MSETAHHNLTVSIHAPAWGATGLTPDEDAFIKFQSTLPRGERPRTSPRTNRPRGFQSTLPRGERHLRGAHYIFS